MGRGGGMLWAVRLMFSNSLATLGMREVINESIISH